VPHNVEQLRQCYFCFSPYLISWPCPLFLQPFSSCLPTNLCHWGACAGQTWTSSKFCRGAGLLRHLAGQYYHCLRRQREREADSLPEIAAAQVIPAIPIAVLLIFSTSTLVCGDQRVTWGHLSFRRVRLKASISRILLLTGFLDAG